MSDKNIVDCCDDPTCSQDVDPELLNDWLCDSTDQQELLDLLKERAENRWAEKLLRLQRPEEYYNAAVERDFKALLIHLTSPAFIHGGTLTEKIFENEIAKACIRALYLLQPEFKIRWDLMYGPLNKQETTTNDDRRTI